MEKMIEENHDDQANEESMEDPWTADLGIGYEYGMNEIPLEVHKDEHGEVGLLIQERVLENMGIVDPCEVIIYNFFHINEGKWDINHHFDNDPIYDTDKENEVEASFPFLLGITHHNIPIHTIDGEDHYFPLHEEGLLEVIGPICDTDDDSNRILTLSCLL